MARHGLSQKSRELAIPLARIIPFVLDNERHKVADVLSGLLAAMQGKLFDVATPYARVQGSGYRGYTETKGPSLEI